MNYSSSNSHKRATSQGSSTKHRRQQSKTPNGASSLSFDLTNSKLNNDKLNFSSVVHGRDPSYAVLEPNLTSTLLQATLSSAAKAKFQYYSETARQDSLFLQSAPAQASGRFDFQKYLFPVKEGQKNIEHLGQTKEVESSLWDSPHSYVENNEDGSVPNNNNSEQANQESDSNIRRNSDYASKRKEIEDIEKLGLNNFGTIKRLKEMIHKLQLKDAIQRQEIEKLKRINQKIKKDSKAFEERANSLERIRIQEFQTMRSPVHAENKAYNMPRKSKPDINTSFHDGTSGQDNPRVKSGNLTQQIDQIAFEKARLEETLKNLLLEREMSKPNINHMKGNNADLDTIPVKETPRKGLNINSLMPTPNAAIDADNLQPFPVVRTPQRDASVRSSSAGRSSARLHEESITTPKRKTQQKSNEIPTEKKHQIKKVGELSSRESSPVVKIGPQTSCAANSYQSGRVSPIDLIFGGPSVPKKEQTPKLSSTRNSPSRERLSAKKEKESMISPAQDNKKYRKDNKVVNKDVLSIDCNPRRASGVEMKNTSNNVLNDSSITPVKALPLFNERSFLDESKSSDSHANSSYLNNVSPAVLEIILQHQKNPHMKANTRKNSASNYSSVESGVPVNLNETYSTKLNLEHLFASHGREKENKKISLDKKNDDGSVTSINIVNALCQGLTHVKIDPQTIPKQIKENKKDEIIEYTSEDKTHRKIPLDEINIAQKRTNYVKSETSTQVPSQNNISVSYQDKSDISLNTSVCPVILSAQPQGKTISSKRAQLALETLRAKMQKRET